MKQTTAYEFAMGCKLHALSEEWLDSAGGAAWSALPIEVLIIVADYLSANETCRVARVCSSWRRQIMKAPRPRLLIDFHLRMRMRQRAAASSIALKNPFAMRAIAEAEMESLVMAATLSRITEELFISGDGWTDAALVEAGITAVLTVLDSAEGIITTLPHLVLVSYCVPVFLLSAYDCL